MKENGWKLFVNILFFWKNCFIDIISQKMFNFKLIFFKWRYCHFGNLQTTGLSFRCISCLNSNDYELNGQEFVAPKPTPSLLLQPNQSLKSAHSPWVARKFSKCPEWPLLEVRRFFQWFQELSLGILRRFQEKKVHYFFSRF